MFYSTATLLAVAASVSSVTAVTKGYNYGATKTDGSAKSKEDFANEFATCGSLEGTEGFTSARLYTAIQAGTASDVSGAIPAAVEGNVGVMLGLWASGGATVIDNEIKALKTAAEQYPKLGKLCEGISVGSEDLYRSSELGVKADAGIGAGPDVVASYIKKVKSALSGTSLGDCPVGHVDTWTAWVNDTNSAVVDAVDFIGFDAYPYFQNTMSNDISDAVKLFKMAYSETEAHAQGKPIIVTETGWPVSGKTENLAVPSLKNAKTYWDEVGCDLLFDQMPTYWYTCQDALPATPNPSFGVIGSGSSEPLYDLSCKNVSHTSSKTMSHAKTSSDAHSSTATDGSDSDSDDSDDSDSHTRMALATGMTTLTNSAGIPTATAMANGTFHPAPVGSNSGSGSGAGATGTAGGAASGPTVSQGAAAALAPFGGLFAAVLAFAAAL